MQLSVVIPVHNAERSIAATVRSALLSDLSDLEVVVVDDGSDDRSAEVVRNIGDPRVVVLQIPASGGPARPRNVGIAQARAPYVALLDADDLLKPDKLSAAVQALERHPEAGFAFGDFEKIDAAGTVLEPSVHGGARPMPRLAGTAVEESWRLISAAELQRGLLDHNFIATSSVVMRRSEFARCGPFDEALVFAEDHDLWFRLAHRCNALYQERVGHSYRVAPGSLTYLPSARALHDRIKVLRREKRRRRAHKERRELDRKIAVDFARLGYLHRRRRERLEAAAAFAQALVRQPSLPWMRALLGALVRLDPTR
jgi:glycosyltransferase involved in cell wall biosynthesis